MIRGDDEYQRKLANTLRPLHGGDLNSIRKARVARDNLRIEELSEAIENLACALAALAMTKADRSRPTHPMVTEYLANSREWVRNALRDFMTPNLHLVEGQARQICSNIPPAERVRCERCKNTTICRDVLCPDWAAAVKHHLGKDVPEELPEDDGPRAA